MASIRERTRKDGTISWAVLWRDADTGKQTSRTTLTAADAQQLVDFLNANGQSFALAAQSAAKLRSTAPKVASVVAGHIDQLTSVTTGTRHRYRLQADRHIGGRGIGAIPVDQLTRADVTTWLNNLGLATKSKKNVHSLLSAALTGAVRDGLIPGNPAYGVRFPREAPAREPVFLTDTEITALVDSTPTEHQIFIRFLVDTGLRWSEATALRPVDLDLSNTHGTVSVTRAWKEIGGAGWRIGQPKTPRARRTVVLPESTTRALTEYVKGRPRDGLLFSGRDGGRIWNTDFHKLVWRPAVAKAADSLRQRPVIHDLRHTHASRLIAKGVPLTVIQRRLGHESIKTTSDTYGHLAADADVAAAAALD